MKVVKSIKKMLLQKEADAYLLRLLNDSKKRIDAVAKKYGAPSQNCKNEIAKILFDYDQAWREYAIKKTKETGFNVDQNSFHINKLENASQSLNQKPNKNELHKN